MAKYTNVKRGFRKIGGREIFFRSRWEANIARYLQFLKECKELEDWRYEEKEFTFEAIKRGTRTYKPDFTVIWKDGFTEYWEVKGWMDSKSATKLKRMAKYFPDVHIRVVDDDAYRGIKDTAKGLVNWE